MNQVKCRALKDTQLTVSSMKPFGMLASAAFIAVWFNQSAVAQPTAPLAYVQPLTPAAVQAVQDHLRSAGAYNGAVDGVWGPDSAAALQRFQADKQLQVTGQLNQATVATLGLDPSVLLSSQQAVLVPPGETLRPGSVRAVQSQLRHLGFYTGNVDGVWGQGTQSAIERFQQGRGLQPNGQLNPATVSAMGLPPDAVTYR
jgi:peptidoglycan hydrolase-like protein with peptidoglycan-binding domain